MVTSLQQLGRAHDRATDQGISTIESFPRTAQIVIQIELLRKWILDKLEVTID